MILIRTGAAVGTACVFKNAFCFSYRMDYATLLKRFYGSKQGCTINRAEPPLQLLEAGRVTNTMKARGSAALTCRAPWTSMSSMPQAGRRSIHSLRGYWTGTHR
jgi:hypothetical protein